MAGERMPGTALTAARVRAHVVRHAFGAGRADLAGTVASLGFVQADPIRAPARAQDLILRHRVRGYRAEDLERRYPALGLDEDFVYATASCPRRRARCSTRAAARHRTGSRATCSVSYTHLTLPTNSRV